MSDGYVDDESWCVQDQTMNISAPKTKRVVSDESNRNEQSYTSSMRDYIYGEKRDPPEGEEPDKIEAHRMEMETQRAPHRKSSRPRKSSSRKIVTQNYYGREVETEKRVKNSMLKVAHTFNDKEIIQRYMSPGTETNNSAMLFLAGSIFSSNQYIFEFLHENYFFNPTSQHLVNNLASDFVTASRNLSNAILTAERASGTVVKNMIVSCVNKFVSSSNKLASVLEEDYTERSIAAGSAKDDVLNNIIYKRNQISDSLHKYFQRTVDDEKAIQDVKEAKETARFLEESQKLTNFLNTEVEKELSGKEDGVEVRGITRKNTFETTRSEARKKSLFQCREKESIAGDASDVLSTASSFLDFINGSSLSVMFDEDERDTKDSGVPEAHLDVIFERMNLSIPAEVKAKDAGASSTTTSTSTSSSATEWGNTRQTQKTKLTAREKRKLLTMARSQARQARREKNLEKKKARAKEQQSSEKDIWGKMSGISMVRKGRKSSMAEI